MAKQIAVRTGVKKRLIALFAPLSKRKRYGTVRIGLLDLPKQLTEKRIAEKRILSALQHEGAKAETIAVFAAIQNLFRG